MNRRTVIYIFVANLIVLALLAFIYPHLMISPGPLIEGHKELTGDCFACHDAWVGTPSSRCIECHKVDRIGVATSKGVPMVKAKGKAPFHHKLTAQDCLACHGDHAGVMKYRRAGGRFSHGLLDSATRGQCASCHARPADALHRQVVGECSQCHGSDAWTPATFEHDKYFRLDQDHNARCVVCHAGNDYRNYTCYGCHEHTPDNIRAGHVEEGIRDYDPCVKCHRSADEEEGEWRREGGRGDDD